MELTELSSLLSGFSCSSQPDKCRFLLQQDSNFTVASLRRLIENKLFKPSGAKIIWIKTAPLKVFCFTWRARLGRIPTLSSLQLKGVNIGSSLCRLCNTCNESADRLLVSCPTIRSLWCKVFGWCSISPPVVQSCRDLIDFAATWGRCPKKKRLLIAIIYAGFWNIRKARNDLIYNRRNLLIPSFFYSIKSIVFVWYKYRGNRGNLNWDLWCFSPFFSIVISLFLLCSSF